MLDNIKKLAPIKIGRLGHDTVHQFSKRSSTKLSQETNANIWLIMITPVRLVESCSDGYLGENPSSSTNLSLIPVDARRLLHTIG